MGLKVENGGTGLQSFAGVEERRNVGVTCDQHVEYIS